MALILCIESSTTMCSVSLAKEGEPIDEMSINDGYSHAEKLAPFVDEILKRNNCAMSTLDAVAVSKGPGSYTGLRIGVSLAKGLCYASSKPLIAVDTLRQMCLHPAVQKEVNYFKDPLLCPMLDARRMEVYASIYDVGLATKLDVLPVVLTENSFQDYLSKEVVLFFGNGAAKFKAIVQSTSAQFVEDVWPTAPQMAMLAELAYGREDFVDLAYFEPNYLKAFQATTPKPL